MGYRVCYHALAVCIALAITCSHAFAGKITSGRTIVSGLRVHTGSDPTPRESIAVRVGDTVYIDAEGDGGPDCFPAPSPLLCDCRDYYSYDRDWEGDPGPFCDRVDFTYYIKKDDGPQELYCGPTIAGSFATSFSTPGVYKIIVYVNDDVWGNRNDAESLPAEVAVTVRYRVDIKWSDITITDTTHDVLAGWPMNLTGTVTPAVEPQSRSWSIPSQRIAGYSIPADFSTGTIIPLTNTSSSSVGFYWLDGGENRSVVYTVTIDGQQYTAQAEFNVKKPTATITSQYGSVDVNENWPPPDGGQNRLTCGADPSHTGITLQRSVSHPQGFAEGELMWLQIAKDCLTRTRAVNDRWWRLHHINLFDGQTTELEVFHDSPFIDLDSATLGNWWEAREIDTFECYLMYRPTEVAGAIWVPLTRTTWQWTGAAIRSGNDWDLSQPTANPTQSSFDNPYATPPTWSGTVDQHWNDWVLEEQ